MNDLFVIGSSNMDMVLYLPRIPIVGETILGHNSSMIFGGKGANQAVSAARNGGRVAFITKIGTDVFGEKMVSNFRHEGLPSEFILTDETEPTGVAQILVSDNGENTVAVAPGANMKLTISDVQFFEDKILEAKVVLLQLEIPMSTVEYVARIAQSKSLKVILNPAPAQKINDDIYKGLWLITPNETEASLLSGIHVFDLESAKEAGIFLLKKGVQHVIITLGEKGSLLCDVDGCKHFPSFKTVAIDTTAAGDVFNGSLAVSISQGKTLNEAIQFGSAAAAISVGRKGAQTSIPYLHEVEILLRK